MTPAVTPEAVRQLSRRRLVLSPFTRSVAAAPRHRVLPVNRDRQTGSARRGIGAVAALSVLFAGMSVAPAAAAGVTTGGWYLSSGQSDTADTAQTLTTGRAASVYRLGALPTAGSIYVGVELRAQGATSAYRARTRVESNGALRVGFSRVSGGKETLLSTTAIPATLRAGQSLHLEGRVSGGRPTTLQVRAWLDGATKPGWQATYVDTSTSVLTAAGAVRTWAYLSTASRPVNVYFSGTTVTRESGTTSATSTPPPPSPAVTGGPPTAANTGVPSGTALKRVDGNVTVTTAGTVLDSLDIHGFVYVQAPNVKIRRSVIRGGRATGNMGLVMNYSTTAKNLVVEDSTLYPEFPSAWIDGIKGANFTARRVNVYGTVDNVKVHGDNVRIESSYLHDSRWFASDPNQGGGASHNDAIQVLGGANIAIVGNSISGASNAGMQVTQDFARIANLSFNNNWADGGTCSVKMSHKRLTSMSGIVVNNNRFGRHASIVGCTVLGTLATNFTATGNVWDDTGAAAPVRRFG